jgi:hypothetical protein
MLKNPTVAAIAATVYLVIYSVLLQFSGAFDAAFAMFLFGPVLLLWLVITVLKFGKYKGKGLGKNEYGYQDKNKGELDVF